LEEPVLVFELLDFPFPQPVRAKVSIKIVENIIVCFIMKSFAVFQFYRVLHSIEMEIFYYYL
jgi:hypothetical protein